ncbi:MAG: lipopolysaccharide assembly protein LapA domain-containing protein [Solirubrobacterales bacterium]
MADDLPTRSGNRRGTRFWVMVVVIVVTAVFIIQNSQKVDVKFFFSTTNIPLIFALLLAAVLGFIIGLALPRFRRHDHE